MKLETKKEVKTILTNQKYFPEKLKWIDENECKKRKEYENENEDWQTKAKSRKQTTHLD